MVNLEVINQRVGAVGWMVGPDGHLLFLPLHPESWKKNEAVGSSPYAALNQNMWEGISGGVKDLENLHSALSREAGQERGLREGYRFGDFIPMPFKVMQNGSRTPTKFDVLVAKMYLTEGAISRLSETGPVVKLSSDYLMRHPEAFLLRPLTGAIAQHICLYGI